MPYALVTGATGCLGQALCADLIAAGWQVVSLSRTERRPEAPVAAHLALDLSRAAPPPELLAGMDAVFHCAALSSAWGRAEDFHAANVIATARLLRAARRAGVGRFVHVSTPSIYITGAPRLNLPETAPLPRRFLTEYAQSKYRAEQAVRQANRPDFTTVTIRPRAIYGRHDRALLPRLLSRLNGPVPLPVPGGGQALIDPTHASDAARAMRLAAMAPAARAGGQVYNITSGQALRLDALLDLLETALDLHIPRLPVPFGPLMAAARMSEAAQRLRARDEEPALTRHLVAALGVSLTLDIRAARRDLGYTPRMRLAEGLADLRPVSQPGPRRPAQARDARLRVDLLRAGTCLAPATALRRDRLPVPRRLPVWVAAIRHPVQGGILFDTGSGRPAGQGPDALALRLAVPGWLPGGETLPAVLRRAGQPAPDLIILSHLHADHAGGLFDLPHLPPVLASRDALAHLARPPAALPGALPEALARRLRALVARGQIRALEQATPCDLPPELAGLTGGYDLCGDGSVISVALPGHGQGQIGLWLPHTTRGPVLLAADAAFSAEALRDNVLPPPLLLARLGDPAAYRQSFAALRQIMARGIHVMTAHDPALEAS